MNFSMKVDADQVIAKLIERKARIPQNVNEVVKSLTAKLLAEVTSRAPVKTGRLRRSIFEEVTINEAQALGRVYVSPDTAYAKFVEFGTQPHDIYPTKASVLAFMMGGKQVFAKMVHHPGTKAQMYLHGPFEELKPEIVARIEGAVREGLK
jgi:HK97 gp10 family phage protein